MTLEAVNPLQRHGYVRAYRAIIATSGLGPALLYGMLEDLAQMGARQGRTVLAPSQAYLAEKLEVGERTVTRYLATLEADGWLARTKDRYTDRFELLSYAEKADQLDSAKMADCHSAKLSGSVGKNGGVKTATPIKTTNTTLASTGVPPSGDTPSVRGRVRVDADGVPVNHEGISLDFLEWWDLYPRKEPSRKEALMAWTRAVNRGAAPEDMLAGLRRWLPVYAVTERSKVPHATTWLNQDRWTVEAPVAPSNGHANGRMAETDAIRGNLAYLRDQAASAGRPPAAAPPGPRALDDGAFEAIFREQAH